MPAGLTSTYLPQASIVDSLMGNRAGSTVTIDAARLAQQLSLDAIAINLETRALLFADLSWPDGTRGAVWGDPTDALRGVYLKAGASGAGSWTRIGDLPQSALSTAQLEGKADQGALDALAADLRQRAGGPALRPGDAMDAWAVWPAHGSGAPETGVTLSDASGIAPTTRAGRGRVLTVTDRDVTLGPRATTPVQPGRVYRVDLWDQRVRAPSDPEGDAVRIRLACLDAGFALVGDITLTSARLDAGAVRHVSATVALSTPLGTPDHLLPAGTVQLRPVVRTFGVDHQTDLIQCQITDITEAAQIEGALDVVVLAGAVEVARAEAAAAALNRAISQLSAELAQTFGPRTKDSRAALLGDTALTTTNTAVGDTVNVRGVGDFVRVPEGGDLTTAGLLRFSAATTALTPEMFASIEDAIETAAETARALVGTPGSRYLFTRSAQITGPNPLKMRMDGCELVRSAEMANDRVLRIQHPMSAAAYSDATTITAFSIVDYDFGNGATAVVRLTVSSTDGYAVGDIVKALSLGIIPSFPLQPGSEVWTKVRYAEMGQIGAIVGSDIYLIRPFSEVWTPTKLVRMTDERVILRGGEWYDEPGYPAARNQPMVELGSCVRPDYRGMHFRDTASTQLWINGCYEPVSVLNRFDRPRHSPEYTAYGYGEKVGGGTTRPLQMLAIGTGCRHIWDTIGADIFDANVAGTHPRNWGGTIKGHVKNGVGFDCINAPWSTHTDDFGTLFENCSSQYSNRRSPQATLWGFELRGRAPHVKGGDYEGLAPVLIQPSTRIPALIEHVTLKKYPATANDTQREPLVHIDGTGIVGGGRGRVTLRDVRIEQGRGRKELILAKQAVVSISGSVKVNADLTVTPVIALNNSDVIFDGLDADYSEASANQPTLVRLLSNGCSILGPGRINIRAPEAHQENGQIVLVSFADNEEDTRFQAVIRLHDVVTDDTLFAGNGFRFPPAGLDAQVVVRRIDTGAVPSDVTANFSGGSGPKTISWPLGTAHPVIFAAINPTTFDTYPGTVPNGAFVGQKLVLSNVGGFSFGVQATGNIDVPSAGSVDVGANCVLRWNGTAWTGKADTRRLSSSLLVDVASIAAGETATFDVTVTGAVLGDEASVFGNTVLPTGLVLYARVTAADTVTVFITNMTAGALNPLNTTYRVRVEKWAA